MNISQITKKYFQKIDSLDLELIIAHELQKTREFVLTYPEYEIPKFKIKNLELKIARRRRSEPLAYILGNKEFYGLNFKVTKDTLIPRPETELLVELALCNIKQKACNKKQETKNPAFAKATAWQSKIQNTKYQIPNTLIIDVGTGSGSIIISLAKELEKEKMLHASCCMLYGTDISKKALAIARSNARKNKVERKIKFIESDLLTYFLKNNTTIKQFNNLIILANLPYLSKEIYARTSREVKYEPVSALYSKNHGLHHYEKLLSQIKIIQKKCFMLHVTYYMEISPEQKNNLNKIIKKYFPKAKATFHKDLAGKWRICFISLD